MSWVGKCFVSVWFNNEGFNRCCIYFIRWLHNAFWWCHVSSTTFTRYLSVFFIWFIETVKLLRAKIPFLLKHFLLLSEELDDSWIKFLQKTDANSDQIGHWYTQQLYSLCIKFTKAYGENNLNEIVASLAESVPYMRGLLPHITCASIRCAYIQVIHQVEVLVSKNPQGQRGFEALYEYLRNVTAIVTPIITWWPFRAHFQIRNHIKNYEKRDSAKEREHIVCVSLLVYFYMNLIEIKGNF